MEIFKRITGWLETGVIVVCYVSPFRRVRVDFDLLVQEGARALMQFLSLCSGAGWRSSLGGLRGSRQGARGYRCWGGMSGRSSSCMLTILREGLSSAFFCIAYMRTLWWVIDVHVFPRIRMLVRFAVRRHPNHISDVLSFG